MSDLKFRPRLKFRTPLHPDDIRDRLRAHVRDQNPNGYRLKGNLPHMILQHAPDQQQLWTPQMDIDLEMEQEPGQETFTIVRCMIGPAPTVWMMFMGAYIALALLATFGLAIGYPQLRLNESPWGLYGAIILVAAGLGLWLLAQVGKFRARNHMVALLHFVNDALGCDCLVAAEVERLR